jgi:hypothetical protein
MVRLKTAGASDCVIRVMIDPHAPETPPAPGVSAVAAPTTPVQSSPSLPSAYGYYIRDATKTPGNKPGRI